ncbi:MAG: tetratricopeptide repeat protein [Terriglobales bacterium]
MRTHIVIVTLLALGVLAFAQAPTAVPAESAASTHDGSLQQARQEFERGNYVKAADLYRTVLGTQPDNVTALAGLVDSLEASGVWRNAMPSLERLVVLQPNNASRVAQLGRWQSWIGQYAQAVQTLGIACKLEPANPGYCTDYADVLAWRSDRRSQAIAQLRTIVAANPKYVPAILKLAQLLTWDKVTRPEGLQLFQKALDLEPKNVDVLISYGEALMYSRSTRATALSLFEHALVLDPKNVRALTGKAQLLAWSGSSREAMSIYDDVLAADPDNVAALRGKAEILNWRGDYKAADALLHRARQLAPDDQRATAELARSQVGLRHWSDAKRMMSQLPPEDEYRDIREGVARALSTWTELGVEFRRNRRALDYDRLNLAVSTPLGFDNRLTFRYAPTLYTTRADEFNSNIYGVDLDSRLSDSLTVRTKLASEQYPGITPLVVGGAQFRFKVNRSLQLITEFQRKSVDEDLVSARGTYVAELFTGQVASNLGRLSLNYSNSRHGYDLSVGYTDGVYTGHHLDSNRQWAVDGDIGKSLGGAPYFRIGYGISYSQFQYDASSSSAPPQQAGGYFSPQRFLINYFSLTFSHRVKQGRLQFEAAGNIGPQNVEDATTAFEDTQFASSFSGRLLWRASTSNEIRIQYSYLDVYNAFHRHLPSVTWRHYF